MQPHAQLPRTAADGAADRTAQLHNRISILLLILSVALMACPLVNLPHLIRLARGQPEASRLLVNAASCGDINAVRRALADGVPADATENGYTALTLADDPAIVRLLLDQGANPNFVCLHQTPLRAAAAKGNLAVGILLLDAGADPNQREADFPSVIETARMWRHESFVRLLLARGARCEVVPEAKDERVDHRWDGADQPGDR